MGIEEFLKSAKNGVVTVEYTRVDTGELRKMPCTLNTSICEVVSKKPFPAMIRSQNASSEYVCVWAIDRAEWRDFRVNTVIRWYPGYPQ